jgi:hypothetical protein
LAITLTMSHKRQWLVSACLNGEVRIGVGAVSLSTARRIVLQLSTIASAMGATVAVAWPTASPRGGSPTPPAAA